MLGRDLILQNPLKHLRYISEGILSDGGVGAILARAGVGKTALMVQFALNILLKKQNVLHISLNDSVKKVSLWYDEVFRNITPHYSVEQMNLLKSDILKHRLIMTFKTADFSFQKLEERLAELKEQHIFFPDMILIDGLDFDETVRQNLAFLESLVKKHSVCVWFSVRTHRHEKPAPDGMPAQLEGIDALFEVIIQLQPEKDNVRLKVLKGKFDDSEECNLFLDPATLLLKEGG